MPSNLKLAAAQRQSLGEDLIADIGVNAILEIYDGTQPASPDTAVSTQVLLAQLTCNAGAFGDYAAGVVTARAITQDSSANATGNATWYRLKTSGGVAKIDGSVGTSGSDLNLNTTAIVAAGPVAVTSLTYTMPGG